MSQCAPLWECSVVIQILQDHLILWVHISQGCKIEHALYCALVHSSSWFHSHRYMGRGGNMVGSSQWYKSIFSKTILIFFLFLFKCGGGGRWEKSSNFSRISQKANPKFKKLLDVFISITKEIFIWVIKWLIEDLNTVLFGRSKHSGTYSHLSTNCLDFLIAELRVSLSRLQNFNLKCSCYKTEWGLKIV